MLKYVKFLMFLCLTSVHSFKYFKSYIGYNLRSNLLCHRENSDKYDLKIFQPILKDEVDLNPKDNNIMINGFTLLNGVAVLWGTQHVVIKLALDQYPSTSVLIFWRFILSSVLFGPSILTALVSSHFVIYFTVLHYYVSLERRK